MAARETRTRMSRDGMPKRSDPTELEPRPQPAPPPDGHSTSAQLRRDIESGATGDKVPVLDPAAAPLGTDDEAAGAQSSPAVVDAVRREERAARPANTNPGSSVAPGAGRGALQLAGLLAFAVALALGALWLSFR